MVLCHETSYETECKLFVGQLDKFLEELLPYLRNPHTVCHWMHMCGNSRIEHFHRVGTFRGGDSLISPMRARPFQACYTRRST
jgi:hypothetical protein